MSNSQQGQLFDADNAAWEDAAAEDFMTADIVFNRPLNTPFSYIVPDALRDMIQPGQRVRAPFGRGDKMTTGFCVGLKFTANPSRRLKPIESVLDLEPLATDEMLQLTEWIAERYLAGWGQVLHSVVPAGVKNRAGTRLVTLLTANLPPNQTLEDIKLPSKQRAVMRAAITAAKPLTGAELAELADCGTGPIKALRGKGLLSAHRERTDSFVADFGDIEKTPDILLNDEQQSALRQIVDVLRAARHETLLLHGVTGSGKTEVYIQAIREVVSYGRQAIVLVPEISLTPQTIRRFRSRFDSVAVLHSHLSDSERHWHWQRIKRGDVEVVVGARSAVFAPTPNLGLIVIDEEHEQTFKQDSVPRYHAREVARKRAALESIPLILGTATPTLESWHRVKTKADTLISMPNRVANLPLPQVGIVDVRNDPRIAQGMAIGRALRTGIQATLKDKGQVILFLNLRGYSTTLWCRACGDGVRCPDCDITLTWHKDKNMAVCHTCDYETNPPQVCPACSNPGVRYFGTGTQKLEQEVRTIFQGAKVLRMDSDSMRKPGSHDEALERFRSGEVQILLGTQMIAKGLDFPNVTLVGVIDADTILHQPDLRSTERTFQLIAQVSGRTGRSARGGRVLVQTASPTEPSIIAASKHDYIGFAEPELANRKLMNAPPYQTLARVIIRGKDEDLVRDYATKYADICRDAAHQTGVLIMGPAPAPIARLRTNYRFHLLLKGATFEIVKEVWLKARPHLPQNVDCEFAIDIDPINMR